MKAQKELTIRAFQIMEHYNMTQGEFAIASGVSSNRFSFLKRGRTMGIDILLGILAGFPDVSAEWLLRGEGKMLKSAKPERKKPLQAEEPPATYKSAESVSYLSQSLIELAIKVGEIQREIAEMKSRL
jgi:transcriptional regulator with XRE-family HTH domain